jgi:UDP-N-acetylmuramoyl-tripeptide--D-alanyl-D-alanine ligase
LCAHNGTIFRNADNPYLEKMYLSACEASGLSGEIIVPPAGKEAGLSSEVNLNAVLYHTGTMPEGTHLVGAYNAENVSAAMCVGEHFGIAPEEALEAIRAYVPTNNRSQLMQTERNTVVVDAYNANPTSMQAAIEAFGKVQKDNVQSTKEAYILGAMRELGEYSHLEHQNIVNMLLERKADKVLLVGEEYKQTTAPYPIFDNVEALCDELTRQPLSGWRILLKGSRSNQLEKVIPLL